MSKNDITGLIEFLPEELAFFLRGLLIFRRRSFIQDAAS